MGTSFIFCVSLIIYTACTLRSDTHSWHGAPSLARLLRARVRPGERGGGPRRRRRWLSWLWERRNRVNARFQMRLESLFCNSFSIINAKEAFWFFDYFPFFPIIVALSDMHWNSAYNILLSKSVDKIASHNDIFYTVSSTVCLAFTATFTKIIFDAERKEYCESLHILSSFRPSAQETNQP